MKKKNVILATLSLSLACSAAAIASVTPVETASANEVTTFEMVEGASIRVAKDGTPGIRFTVQVDETLKEKVEAGTATLGFVASQAENFAGVNGDYLNTVSTYLNPTIGKDMIYADETKGGYYANIAIIGEIVSQHLAQDWSAIAYYTEGETTTYAGEVQTRSIQLVASRLYFDNSAEAKAKWEGAKEVYASLGTEAMPLLVENGEYGELNSYQALVARESTIGDLKFKMTENVVAEREAEVGVIVNADDYTVSSPEGLIWDSSVANQNFIWLSGDKGDTAGHSVSYDESKKFNGVGNGSAELTLDYTGDTVMGNLNVFINFKPAYTQAYYKALYEAGYTHLTVRYMVPNFGKDTQIGTTLENYISYMFDNTKITQIYEDGTDAGVGTYFDYSMGKKMNSWLELSWPIKTLNDDGTPYDFNGFGSFPLFRTVGRQEDRKLTVYIDNVYMTKSAGTYSDTEQVITAGTTVDLENEYGMTLTGAHNAIENFSEATGATIERVDNKVTIDGGLYDFTFRADNRFGIAKKVLATIDTATTVHKFYRNSVGTLPVVYYNGAPATTITPEYDTTVKFSETDAGSLKFSFAGNEKLTLTLTTYKDKAFYETMKAEYQYVTVRIAIMSTVGPMYYAPLNITAMEAKNSWGELLSHNNQISGSPDTGVISFNVKTGATGNGGLYTEKTTTPTWFDVSISIDSFLNNYVDGKVNLVNCWYSWAALNFYLDGVYLTKTGRVGA